MEEQKSKEETEQAQQKKEAIKISKNISLWLAVALSALISGGLIGGGIFLWQNYKFGVKEQKMQKQIESLSYALRQKEGGLKKTFKVDKEKIQEEEDLEAKKCPGMLVDGACVNLTCIDTDFDRKPDDIYTKGAVIYLDETGEQITAGDKCLNTSKLNEMECKEVLNGDTKYLAEAVVIDCTYGCEDGKCVPLIEKKFSFPYPVTWKESDTTFSLTGVSIGTRKVEEGERLHKLNPPGAYQTGEKIHALTLFLRIDTRSARSVPLNLRRIEEGRDRIIPNNRDFSFPDSGGIFALEERTYRNQKVVFEVPEGEKEFTITTGGTSNAFFIIQLTDDGDIQVVP